MCSQVTKNRRVSKLSPIPLMKAIKNETEIEGMKQAHVSDITYVTVVLLCPLDKVCHCSL